MAITTTAAVVEAAGAPFALEEVEPDDPGSGEVLVRMVAAGLCHTDLSVQAGHISSALPGVLGHEGAGVVEAVGPGVRSVAPGDAVALTFNSCGACRECHRGHPAYCATWVPANLFNGGVRTDGSATIRRSGTDIGGRFFGQSSFSARAIASVRSVVRVADDLPLEFVAPLGCGIQTGAGTVMNILRPRAGSMLAVFGTGAGSPTDITGGAGVDYVIDTTARMTILRIAIEALGSFGTCAAIGAAPIGTELTVDYTRLLTGRSIIGVTEGDSEPATFIPLLADLCRQGRLPLEKLVRTYPFAEINRAAADAREGKTIKPVLVFDGA